MPIAPESRPAHAQPRPEDLTLSCVALDLETTGLDHDQDAIIEIGAVKFDGLQVLDTFQTLVNPYRQIPPFVLRLTGITQKNVDRAPPFAAVAGELQEFIGGLPVVGHNTPFDLGFLSRNGLPLNNLSYDTWDLASVLLPYSTDYSLSRLVKELGSEHPRPHRALSDAQATHDLFMRLLDLIGQLDPATAGFLEHLGSRAQWPTGRLFGSIKTGRPSAASSVGLTGFDPDALAKRLSSGEKAKRLSRDERVLDEKEIEHYLSADGMFSSAFPSFEYRPQQVEMAGAVTRAIVEGEHLIVEAGTGVGKTIAYLLPAIIHAANTGTRMVISTNTINLQEQLLQKDIPALIKILEDRGTIPQGQVRAAPLKGRANYICLRRWNNLSRSDELSHDEARLLGKTLVWLEDTCTGDRTEITLSGRDSVTWGRVAAAQKGGCPGTKGEGPCFLRAARERAEGAQVVVVNHALLLSDLALGGSLLPDYQHLIVDEAHRLEEEATRQLGFEVSETLLVEELETLERTLAQVRVSLRTSSASATSKQQGEKMVSDLEPTWSKGIQTRWKQLWDTAETFLSEHQEGSGEVEQLRVTNSTRGQPAWSNVEIAWENVDIGLSEGIRQLYKLVLFLERGQSGNNDDPQSTDDLISTTAELSSLQDTLEGLQKNLKLMLTAPNEEVRIDWMQRTGSNRSGTTGRSRLVFHSAPLNVKMDLEERLFSKKKSVVLTSATLSTQGNFDYIRERVGLADSGQLLVGSPFDYTKAALLLLPEDMPMLDNQGFQQASDDLLTELGKRLNGHTLVLFTSHSALRTTARNIRAPLEVEGVKVLAQGIDGSPRQILQSFNQDPKSIILGTSSFWEGVDLSGGILQSLVITRLPFHVPTEPIFAARSAEYEDPFHQYALPQAVLRLRQGIGRLVRSKEDRGTIIVLDRRIIARSYGKAFIQSLPPCTMKQVPLSTIPDQAASWVNNRARNAGDQVRGR